MEEANSIEYECLICKDTELIWNPETRSCKPCSCREAKRYKRILESSGISTAFQKKSFKNYDTRGLNILKTAKQMAMAYVKDFEKIKEDRQNSIALLGQVGAGKTHLSIAIANELMKNNIGVRYMQYREDIVKIKQVANDEISYQNEISKYKNATVLLIDDLFKEALIKRGSSRYINEADLRVMFEIINFRYFKNAPIIVSSEYKTDDLLDFDEGLGSRIIHMCKGRIFEFNGQELNYRLSV
jgi:DNA replication protein DnaC